MKTVVKLTIISKFNFNHEHKGYPDLTICVAMILISAMNHDHDNTIKG